MKKYQKSIDKNNKIYGIIPARMAASRFPGKPLKKICNIAMVEHVYRRASLFKNWKKLILATCDKEILQFAKNKNIPATMTSSKHKRCLDRVYEAILQIEKKEKIKDADIIICVQGDEPMLHPQMIRNSLKPILNSQNVNCTVLAMDIVKENQFLDPNVVKVVHDIKDEVLYTSRSPIPYCKKFSKYIRAKRIYGIFAFRWKFLKKFTNTKESFLERVESCDSNRICDNNRGQFIARQKFVNSFSVDCPADLTKVSKYMKKDTLFRIYKNQCL
jgi:3-deoxy-manno-octulosonate cytidylyltransferase (CMP-KDO synthetase)